LAIFFLEAGSQGKTVGWQEGMGDNHLDGEEEHLCDYAASQ
jgi:hypothetical protein